MKPDSLQLSIVGYNDTNDSKQLETRGNPYRQSEFEEKPAYSKVTKYCPYMNIIQRFRLKSLCFQLYTLSKNHNLLICKFINAMFSYCNFLSH